VKKVTLPSLPYPVPSDSLPASHGAYSQTAALYHPRSVVVYILEDVSLYVNMYVYVPTLEL